MSFLLTDSLGCHSRTPRATVTDSVSHPHCIASSSSSFVSASASSLKSPCPWMTDSQPESPEPPPAPFLHISWHHVKEMAVSHACSATRLQSSASSHRSEGFIMVPVSSGPQSSKLRAGLSHHPTVHISLPNPPAFDLALVTASSCCLCLDHCRLLSLRRASPLQTCSLNSSHGVLECRPGVVLTAQSTSLVLTSLFSSI